MFAGIKRLHLTWILLTLITILLLLERFPASSLFFCSDCSEGSYRKINFLPFLQSHKKLVILKDIKQKIEKCLLQYEGKLVCT